MHFQVSLSARSISERLVSPIYCFFITDKKIDRVVLKFPEQSNYFHFTVSVELFSPFSKNFKMFPKCILFFLLNFSICWSSSVSLFDKKLHQLQITPYLEDIGEPLILTPLIKSNEIEKARNLSTVAPFLNYSGIVSHSGYFTVNETYNSNLFFWFFRKNGSDWQNASLLLWLQGGPGASSLIGLFNENGPFMYTKTGLQLRNISWTNDYNVLYIDQPVGTGFSFTDFPSGYINTQEEVAEHLYEALIQFFQLFPELSRNEFYITGESYAGKYIPAISYKIHRMKMANLTNINLKGLFMISALTDGLMNGLAEFCFQVGIIDSKTKVKLEELEEIIELGVRSKFWKIASDAARSLLDKIVNDSDVNLFDYRKHYSSYMKELDYVEFLQLSDVRIKIHVGNRAYDSISKKVLKDFHEDTAKSVSKWIGELLNSRSTRIAFVGGQYDVRTAHPLVVNSLKRLEWYGAFAYRNIINRFIVDSLDAGYYTSSGPLTDILIREAGHMVPKDQPQATLTALRRFTNDDFWLSNITQRC